MYTFRVKPDTPLDKLVDYVLAHDGIQQEALHAEGFGWGDINTLYKLGRACDNFTLTAQGGTYTEVIPQTVIQHAETVDAQLSTARVAGPTDHAPIIRWPDVPMVADRMENFRTPSWYARMKMMVQAGRHIMLKGPPGIGKSTQ